MFKNIYFFTTSAKQNRLSFIKNKHFSIKTSLKDSLNLNNAKSNTKPKEETIFIFSHDTARKYYSMNVIPLIGYIAVSAASLVDSDYPDYLRKTMYFFMATGVLILTGLSIYAKRHVHSMQLVKPSNILLIKTFSKFGFGKDRTYQVPIKDIVEMIPISKFIRTKNTGIYIMKPNQNTKYFRFMNFFFIRPKSSLEFDQIFKSKIKK